MQLSHVERDPLQPFALTLWVSTIFLLAAGALVTGTGSGLAVPDWPLSFGQFFPEMVGGVFYEHGHRMVAGTVAILTVGFAILGRNARNKTVKILGFCAVGVVLTQATLGGMTVLYKLPTAVSVSHACLAQIFFSITALLALMTSKGWQRLTPWAEKDSLALFFARFLTIAIFIQLLLGAIMRHKGAGLAIPTYPKAFGQWIPEFVSFPVTIHFAHRTWAWVVAIFSAATAFRILAKHYGNFLLTFFSGVILGLVGFQVLLGAFVIWLRKPIPLTTVHLVVGAIILATSVCLNATLNKIKSPKDSNET